MTRPNELDLIGWIRGLFPQDAKGLALGIGDDCAAIRPSPGHETLLTTDTLVEGTHFRLDMTTPRLLGGKAASVNMSDIAAMGGMPRYMLLSVNVSGGIGKRWLVSFLEGFKDAISPFAAALVGGNVAASQELSFTVTVIGEVARGRRVDRNGAKPGDLIFVTGSPGDAALGLEISLKGEKRLEKYERKLVSRFLSPTVRVEWGMLLASEKIPSAMIDVSDGVALDLQRIAQASGVRARLELSGFPLSDEAKTAFGRIGASAWRKALSGGEDYELLFTLPKGRERRLRRLIAEGKIDATLIGHIVEGAPDVDIIDADGEPLRLRRKGWIHR